VVEIARGPYFVTHLYRLAGQRDDVTLDTAGRRFHALTCIEGRACVEAASGSVAMGMGDSVLVPAAVGKYRLTGDGHILMSAQPL
jgi:mannose-6-phosphate isomerase